ncbi:MAG: thioredoxin domain-containing protein [Candidatus Binatia bacterium]
MSAKRPAFATLALALIGLAVSMMITRTHAEINNGLPTGCTINEQINCVPVLSSSYAYLFGLPVAWFALAAYAVMATMAGAAAIAESAARRRQLASLLLVSAVGSVLVSAYLAYVAFVVIGHVCPQCTSLYVVNLLLLASTTWLTGATQGATRDREAWQSRGRLIAAGVLGTLVVLIAGVLWKGFSNPTPLSAEEVCARDAQFCAQYRGLPVVPVDVAGGHAKGRPDAPVTIVEFSDFECGHCKLAWEGLKQALPIYGDLVRVIHHHFPLDGACNPSIPPGGGHKYACLAAMAAECAGAQGKFWQYQDTLFEHQPMFTREDLLRYAEDLGLDRDRFIACLDSDAPREAVRQDVASGTKLGIDSTPTIYINGRTVHGALRGDTFGYAIVLERAAKSKREG